MFHLDLTARIATIRIARGEKRNAIPISGWAELEALVRSLPTSDALMLVIRSDDPDDFCAGSDLAELQSLATDRLMRKRFRGAMVSALKRIRDLGIPTVCLVNGGCFGTGVSLAAACDLRVARPDACFAITSARFGISYPQADLQRLVDLVGPGQAARLVYTSDQISGTQAQQIGLVELLDAQPDLGADLIRSIAANAPNSLAALKAVLLGRRGTDELFDGSFSSTEFVGSMKAFAAKRRGTDAAS